jgi:hypothetical protein
MNKVYSKPEIRKLSKADVALLIGDAEQFEVECKEIRGQRIAIICSVLPTPIEP